MIVKVAEERTFANVLIKFCEKADVEASQTRVVGALPNKKRDLI